MSDTSDEVPHGHGLRGHPHLNLPALPDLRFENSYLRSINPFITLHDADARGEIQKQEQESLAGVVAPPDTPAVNVEWKGILWVTARDQVVYPLLQGFLWGITSQYLLPLPRAWWEGLRQPRSKRNGDDVSWLRQWTRSFTGAGKI
ncbi:hypothetical protein BOTBODRAFT_58196 [Botryobasidium botryosum FD-172 SS1]|uniref:Uncharacterized protein n=1 Tax=Botryobasidium botryosum (strain FD-172 SS1) TaxID=930990 RepID=A0A067MEH7_BOTB1|nr:hypothetical protein BOTBODRAFT_58196 [Botryobasidium botryosum FD-172 SS1]